MEELLLKLICLLKEKFYNERTISGLGLNQYLDRETELLSGIVQYLLEENKLIKGNWIDDIILRDLRVSSEKAIIYGNAIYGKSGTTKECGSTLVFHISINTDRADFIAYEYCFGKKRIGLYSL